MELVTQGLLLNKGAIAISCVTEAVLGEGNPMEMVYTKKQYTRLKRGDTLLAKSNMVPCSLACAIIPKIGITTADKAKPNATNHHKSPALNPNCGGNIRLPAPKKSENRAKAVTRISFLRDIYKNSVER